MAKKLASFMPVHGAKLMKKRGNKKRLLLKRVLDFLKSDNYMFAPLVSSQGSVFATSPTGVEANEPVKEKNEKLLGNLKNYMKSDCYMYAPLVLNEPWLRAAVSPAHLPPGSVSFSETTADTSRQRDMMENVTKETGDLAQNINRTSIQDQLIDGYPHTRSAVIRHNLLQRETVKHVIQQNIRHSTVQGDEKKEKKGGTGAKIKGSYTANTKKKKRVAGR